VSFLSQLVEVPDAREAVQHLVRTLRAPQVVLRIGHVGTPTPMTPRRPIADLIMQTDRTALR
jgi:hypothetical protein